MRLAAEHKAFFPFPDDPDETKYEFKYLRSGEQSKITSATTSQRFEMRSGEEGAVVPVSVLENKKAQQREMTAFEALTNWENQLDEGGEPMEFNHKNKRRFFRELSGENFVAFLAFYDDCSAMLEKQVKEQEAARMGN